MTFFLVNSMKMRRRTSWTPSGIWGEMQDSRIVPSLVKVLETTKSDDVVEAVIEALSKQKDVRAVPALREAADRPYDDFLKLSIAKAQNYR